MATVARRRTDIGARQLAALLDADLPALEGVVEAIDDKTGGKSEYYRTYRMESPFEKCRRCNRNCVNVER